MPPPPLDSPSKSHPSISPSLTATLSQSHLFFLSFCSTHSHTTLSSHSSIQKPSSSNRNRDSSQSYILPRSFASTSLNATPQQTLTTLTPIETLSILFKEQPSILAPHFSLSFPILNSADDFSSHLRLS